MFSNRFNVILPQITGFTLWLQHPDERQTDRRNHGTNETSNDHGVLLR